MLPPVSGHIMPLSQPFKAKRLNQHNLKSVGAYEGACKALGLVDRSDPLTQLVAKKIIALAGGQRDPERICRALKAPAISACWDDDPHRHILPVRHRCADPRD